MSAADNAVENNGFLNVGKKIFKDSGLEEFAIDNILQKLMEQDLLDPKDIANVKAQHDYFEIMNLYYDLRAPERLTDTPMRNTGRSIDKTITETLKPLKENEGFNKASEHYFQSQLASEAPYFSMPTKKKEGSSPNEGPKSTFIKDYIEKPLSKAGKYVYGKMEESSRDSQNSYWNAFTSGDFSSIRPLRNTFILPQ